MIEMVKKPCIGCVYFKVCGNTNRTRPCEGRQTKTQRKEMIKDERASSR